MKGGDFTAILSAGLPNISGSTNTLHVQPLGPKWAASGAFGLVQSTTYGANSGRENSATVITFNASLSNNIYGKAETVQPPAIVLIPQIRY